MSTPRPRVVVRTGVALAIGMAALAPRPAVGQGHPTPDLSRHAEHESVPPTSTLASTLEEREAFVLRARAELPRYTELSRAVADGYRRVGDDLASMGEHWVNLRLLIGGVLDPAAPPILLYARTEGGRRLVGAAYSRLLAPGEPYPGFPGLPHVWHDHNGAVDDEVLPFAHGADADSGAAGTRLAVLHLWPWTDDEFARWQTENWSLPWIRLDLAEPSDAPSTASRALALATGGDEQLRRNLITVVGIEPPPAAAAALTVAAERVGVWVSASRSGLAPSVAELARIWRSLWEELERTYDPADHGALRELRLAWER